MISLETTKEDLEKIFDNSKHFVLPIAAAICCILVTLVLSSIGFDRLLVTVLGAIWFALFAVVFFSAQKKTSSDFLEVSPDSEIGLHLNGEFRKRVKVFASITPGQSNLNLAKAGDRIVTFDANQIAGLPAQIAAKVIELSHRARIFSFWSLIHSVFRGWIGTSVIALFLCSDLLHFTVFVFAALIASPLFLLLALLYQFFFEAPVLVESESDLNSLVDAQKYLESQKLPLMFPTNGWTRLQVLFSKRIVAKEVNRFVSSHKN